jgi:hypothetical protein
LCTIALSAVALGSVTLSTIALSTTLPIPTSSITLPITILPRTARGHRTTRRASRGRIRIRGKKSYTQVKLANCTKTRAHMCMKSKRTRNRRRATILTHRARSLIRRNSNGEVLLVLQDLCGYAL